MRLFAVRVKDNREPVGVFWVNDLPSLSVAVDEVLNPDLCEYKPIDQESAITWDSRVLCEIGTKLNDDDADAHTDRETTLKKGLSFDGAFHKFLLGYAEIKHWKSF